MKISICTCTLLLALAVPLVCAAQAGPALGPDPDADAGEEGEEWTGDEEEWTGDEEDGDGEGESTLEGWGDEEEDEDWEMSDEELEALAEEAGSGEGEGAAGPGAKFLSMFEFGGYFETDLRSTVPGKEAPGIEEDFTWVRSENTFRLKIEFVPHDMVRAVFDTRLVFTGILMGDDFADLTFRDKVDPVYVESDSLFIQLKEVAPGLDIRLGRQQVVWGTGDKFNPTNNLNPLDLEDPIMFGEPVANEMLLVTYAPYFVVEGKKRPVFEELAFTFAFIPIFRPAQLPFWTIDAISDSELFRQQVHDERMFNLLDLQDLYISKGGDLGFDLRYRTPEITPKNFQAAAKVGWTLLGVDMSVSYAYVFDDMPRAERVYANDLYLGPDRPLPPLDPGDGLYEILERMDDLSGSEILNEVVLSYPRMHVLGTDFSTSLDFLGGLGLWGEAAFYFHGDQWMQVRTSGAWVNVMGQDQLVSGIERNYQILDHPDGWFWKLTLGMDYSITSWWYVNVQYVHGFIDEFGDINTKDHLVAGMDFNLFNTRMLIRLFSVTSFPYEELCSHPGREIGETCKREASAVLFPMIRLGFLKSTEIDLGALVYVGKKDTKFGSPISGPNMVFLKVRVSI